MPFGLDAVERKPPPTAKAVAVMLVYTLVPYVALLLVRSYVLLKAQAFRRSLRRNAQWRQANENTSLVGR